MPPGTPAGLSGATPAGRVLFFLDTENLVGGDAFEFGQHLDLVASRTDEQPRGARGGYSNVTLTDAQRTRVEPVAEDVIVMMPTNSLGNPTSRRGDSSDREAQLIVAVRPEQVAALEYAVAVGSNLRATIRSRTEFVNSENANSIAESDSSSETVTMMRFDPMQDSKRTDIFVGGSRDAQLFQAGQ
jgi:hypothetical protein